MSATVSIDVTGLRALDGFMADIARVDTTELMERIGIVAEDGVSENFEGEHDPDGAPWLPSFRAKTTGGKTLTEKGLLAGSIESHATRDQVEVGSNLIFAGIHQRGGTIKGNPRLKFMIPGLGFRSPESVTIPARPFLGWGPSVIEEANAQAEDWLAELLPPGALS